MRKLMLFIVVGIFTLTQTPAQSYYAELSNTRSASASISGSGSASVYAQVKDAISEYPTSTPTSSSSTSICASVSSGSKYDTGCALLPVVIDAFLGTAQASGTINAGNCLSVCPRGAITVNVTWAAISQAGPVPPGIPWFCLDPFLQCAEVRVGATISRTATASGTVSSTYAGTVTGSTPTGSIAQTVRLMGSM